MLIDESSLAFDTRKLTLEVAREPTNMRIRLDGVNKAGSMLGSSLRFDGVEGPGGEEEMGVDGGEVGGEVGLEMDRCSVTAAM